MSRRDFEVPNETDAFAFTSAAQRGRGFERASIDALAVAVESEDAANVRVVVDEPLEAGEAAEWVGVVRSALRVPDGKLVLAGGISYLVEEADWAAEEARVLDVPPGTYRATLYCYASAPNGRWCAAQVDDEPLGTWFRRTRPGAPVPPWLHNLCVNDPDLDPAHRREWKKAREVAAPAVIDFLLHLERADDATAPRPEGDAYDAAECRKPEPFPLGIAAVGLPGVPGAPEPAAADAQAAAPTAGAMPIAGGPVALPAHKLGRLARLAWFCQPYTRPVLRLVFPGKAPALDDVDGAKVRAKGGEVEVTFTDDGQPAGAADALSALGKFLTTVPDGTTFDLELARKNRERVGLHRYKGTARGGAWEVAEAFPGVDAERLREALAIAEALENGRRFAARDEAEAERIEARANAKLADLFGGNPLTRTGSEIALKRRDPVLFNHVLSRVFWMRYAGTWPLQDEDA